MFGFKTTVTSEPTGSPALQSDCPERQNGLRHPGTQAEALRVFDQHVLNMDVGSGIGKPSCCIPSK